jgi:two-component system, OmpR family, phosphate regulon sensor histidine kinase PhoR
VIFSISDTGIGIPSEHQTRVFDRFYRVDRTRGGASRGAGLGLALAKWIAEKHHTTLSLDSAIGRGTTLRFEMHEEIGVPSTSVEKPKHAVGTA